MGVAEAARLWPVAANMVACHVAGLGLGWLQVSRGLWKGLASSSLQVLQLS